LAGFLYLVYILILFVRAAVSGFIKKAGIIPDPVFLGGIQNDKNKCK
jgi:hypothetical protein